VLARLTLVVVLPCVATALLACSHSGSTPAPAWDAKGAAAYLDRRMRWWVGWKGARRDHGTFCVSCHTAVPYALARPALRTVLAEPAPVAAERRLLDDVRQRVRLWSETDPFYTDQYNGVGKTEQSRGTEAVLNALMLVWNDAPTGRLSDEAGMALAHLWETQKTTGEDRGAWSWLDFDSAPWEVDDAEYYGAALAALAVGTAPQDYQSRASIHDPLQELRDYLAREYPAQSLHHRLILLWASTKLPGVLQPPQRQALIAEVLRAQNPDGGWSLSALVPKTSRRGALLRYSDSDGYATGLATLVLEQTAMPAAAAEVQRGRSWLVRNQCGPLLCVRGPEEFWVARSLNKRRNPWSRVGRFMTDAATAYAVLALAQAPHAGAEATSRR
jgi:squalene-hopene/tetraprenyl-beta-curcumene cyclase